MGSKLQGLLRSIWYPRGAGLPQSAGAGRSPRPNLLTPAAPLGAEIPVKPYL